VDVIQGLINGIISKGIALTTTIFDTVSKMLKAFTDRLFEFYNMGLTILDNLKRSFVENAYLLVDQAIVLVTDTIAALRKKLDDFYTIGVDIVMGVVKGIGDTIWKAVVEAYTLATKVANIIKTTLKINSPSKVTKAYGVGTVEGYVDGMKEESKSAYREAKLFGDGVASAFQTAIANAQATIDNNTLVFTPVVDMASVTQELATANKAYFVPVSAKIAGKMSPEEAASLGNGTGKVAAAQGTTIYNQYNTSPKALSPFEIYRLTRNQLAQAEKKG
jgi:hypothetical protein